MTHRKGHPRSRPLPDPVDPGLPPHLREVSEPFCTLASWIELHLPDNPERAKALDLLLVSKDAAVRAKLAR